MNFSMIAGKKSIAIITTTTTTTTIIIIISIYKAQNLVHGDYSKRIKNRETVLALQKKLGRGHGPGRAGRLRGWRGGCLGE